MLPDDDHRDDQRQEPGPCRMPGLDRTQNTNTQERDRRRHGDDQAATDHIPKRQDSRLVVLRGGITLGRLFAHLLLLKFPALR